VVSCLTVSIRLNAASLFFLYYTCRRFKWSAIVTHAAIWLTATYSAASFDWPLFYTADKIIGAIFECFFLRGLHLHIQQWVLTDRYNIYGLTVVLSFGAIWLTDTYSAVTFFWPPYFIAVNGDLPLYMSRRNLTARHLFSGNFFLTAIFYSGERRLAAVLSYGAIWLAATYSAAGFDWPPY
jgi:hypothetical protein